jgi:hypothetical protein
MVKLTNRDGSLEIQVGENSLTWSVLRIRMVEHHDRAEGRGRFVMEVTLPDPIAAAIIEDMQIPTIPAPMPAERAMTAAAGALAEAAVVMADVLRAMKK